MQCSVRSVTRLNEKAATFLLLWNTFICGERVIFTIKCENNRLLHIIRTTAINTIVQVQGDVLPENSNEEASKGVSSMYPSN